MKELLKRYAIPVGLGLITTAVGVFVVRRNSVEEEGVEELSTVEGVEELSTVETVEPVVQGTRSARVEKIMKQKVENN